MLGAQRDKPQIKLKKANPAREEEAAEVAVEQKPRPRNGDQK